MIHDLKILPVFFKAILSGEKKFELRINDRKYKVNDILYLNEWNPETKEYSGDLIKVKVDFILHYSPGMSLNHIIMSISFLNGER